MSSGETSIRTVVLGTVLGFIATALAYKHAPGLGLATHSVLLVAALLLFARVQGVRPVARNLFMIVPTLFFALTPAIRSELGLTMLNLCAAASAALLLIYFFASGNFAQQSVVAYPTKAFISGIAVGLQPFAELAQSRKWLAAHQGVWGRLTPFVRGTVITIPVVAVFIILLSSADEVFSRLVRNIVTTLLPRNVVELVFQLTFTGIFAWLAIGGLSFALLERKAKRAPIATAEPIIPEPEASVSARVFGLGFTETTMLLGSVCLVFASFVVIQFVYLFGGQQNIANFSYADYVRRGFAELVIVALLTLGLVITLNTISARNSTRQVNMFRALSTVLIVLTGVILVSAFQRLRLYELAYGFTALRLLIYVFIVWLGVLFVGFNLSLFWTPATINVFGLTVLVAVFGFVATLDILNPDAFVAAQNLNRGDIDPLYLSTLSEEAVPVLVTLVDAPQPGLRSIIRSALMAHERSLSWYRNADWRDYSLARSNAVAALDSVKDKLTQETPTKTLDELKAFLRQGMTTREVIRELGMPVIGYIASDFAEVSGIYSRISDRKFNVVFLLAGNDQVSLRFDTAAGLESVCLVGDSGTCKQVVQLNP